VSLLFSPAAQDDLMEIAVFIAQDKPKRALTFVEELEASCETLAHQVALRPNAGSMRTNAAATKEGRVATQAQMKNWV
jgi:toxin ParE1/3/4